MLAAVSVTHCPSLKGKVKGGIEIPSEEDCPLLDMAGGDVVLEVGPSFLCGCALLGVWRKVCCN